MGRYSSDEDGDNVWTGSGEFDPAIGQFEYVVAVTGPTDGYSGWGMQWSLVMVLTSL